MGRLDGKVALITGGARGMGASHAKKFIEEGAKVVITDILVEDGEKTANELGENCLFMKHDVTKEDEWVNVVAKTEEAFGPINVLINNAGIAHMEPTEEHSVENFNRVYEINQLSVFLGMKVVLPSLKKATNASIINISSISGIVGQPNTLAYNATKFAVRGMTKSAALEFGPLGIRVNSIHPGIIKTPMTSAEDLQDVIAQMAEQVPLRRVGEANEITNLCLYLASDESSYCTGSEFVADGGLTAM